MSKYVPKLFASYLIVLVILYIVGELLAPEKHSIYSIMFFMPFFLFLNSNMSTAPLHTGLWVLSLYLEFAAHIALLLVAISILKQKKPSYKIILISFWMILIAKLYLIAPIYISFFQHSDFGMLRLTINLFLNPILIYGLPIYLLSSKRLRKILITENTISPIKNTK